MTRHAIVVLSFWAFAAIMVTAAFICRPVDKEDFADKARKSGL